MASFLCYNELMNNDIESIRTNIENTVNNGITQITDAESIENGVRSTIEESVARFTEAELVVMMAIGAAVLLAGYRIKKIAFFIVWFIIGLNLAHLVLPWVNSTLPDIANSDLWQNLIPIAGGLLLALMGFSIEKVCVGALAFALTMMIVVQYFGAEMQTLAIGGVIGVIAAGAAVMMIKPAIILATSIAGSYAITIGVMRLAGLQETVYFPMLIGIAVLGAAVQFATSKRA